MLNQIVLLIRIFCKNFFQLRIPISFYYFFNKYVQSKTGVNWCEKINKKNVSLVSTKFNLELGAFLRAKNRVPFFFVFIFCNGILTHHCSNRVSEICFCLDLESMSISNGENHSGACPRLFPPIS